MGCKKCISSLGCPAISFDRNATGVRNRDRGQATIDVQLCVGCNLCVQVCPFKAIEAPAMQSSAGLAEAGPVPDSSEATVDDRSADEAETQTEAGENPSTTDGHKGLGSIFQRITGKGGSDA